MKLQIVNNTYNHSPYLTKPLSNTKSITQRLVKYFDKDGYELTPLEQMYHAVNGVILNEKHLYHTADHVTWFIDTSLSDRGVVLDHSMLTTRWAYADEAKEQLLQQAQTNPLLYKLLSIKPKWGFDLSLDYVYDGGCMELFHVEYDFDNYDQACEMLEKATIKIQNTDWDFGAKQIFQRMTEWEGLCSDDQSDWKANFFGWARAFDNLKVYKTPVNKYQSE